MPRKRRTTNADKAPKLWIAPEWTAKLHESRSSHVLGSDFSRYLDLADRVLAKEANASTESERHEPGTERDDSNPEAPKTSPETLLDATAPRMSLPKPPRRPVHPKPPKLMMPKPPAGPKLQKPRTINFPKPPRRNW
jgi:hypothetical protein